jgi:hypothetical protein
MSESKYIFYKNVFKGNYKQSKLNGGTLAESTTNIDTSGTQIDTPSANTTSTPNEANPVVTDTSPVVTQTNPAVTETVSSETPKSKVEFKFSLDQNLSINPKTNIDLMFFKSIFGF